MNPAATDPLALWAAWIAACDAVAGERIRRDETISPHARAVLAPLEEKRDEARAAFEACDPHARFVGGDGDVPYASPYLAVPAGASVDMVNAWVRSWWPAVRHGSHHRAVEASMAAFGWYVARRIAGGMTAEQAVRS